AVVGGASGAAYTYLPIRTQCAYTQRVFRSFELTGQVGYTWQVGIGTTFFSLVAAVARRKHMQHLWVLVTLLVIGLCFQTVVIFYTHTVRVVLYTYTLAQQGFAVVRKQLFETGVGDKSMLRDTSAIRACVAGSCYQGGHGSGMRTGFFLY